MPQQKRKLRPAAEILGLPPKPLRPAAEILGIAPSAPQPPQPAQQPQGVLGSLQSGLASRLLSNVVETAADFYNAPGETLERVGRAGLEFASAFDPAGNAYNATVQSQAPRVQELNRRADERLPEPIQSMKRGMALEAERPRTGAGNIAYGAGSILGDIAFPTNPETVIANLAMIPAGGAAAKAAGKFVAPILQRIRAGKAVPAAAEQASIRAESSVARLEAPPMAQSLPDGPPLLEEAPIEEFGVSLGKSRPASPGKTGPKIDEYGFVEGQDYSKVSKAERTPVLEVISAFRKAGLLTGIKTHFRNIAGSGGYGVIGEEISRIPGAVVDSLVSRVTKQRTLTGPNLGSMGRSFLEAATDGVKQAKQAWKTGRTKFDTGELQEIASGSKVLDTYVNGVFRTLKAEDAVFKSYALRRSLEDRARALALTEVRQGKILRGQVGERTREILKAAPADMANAAMLDAEVATFNNPNVVADAFGKGVANLPKGVQFAIDLFVPFRKTPTNVIARMIEYSPLGLVKSAGQAAKLANGILKKSFTAEQQRAFSQTFGRASAGSALMALGYIGYRDGWLTGLQEDDSSRRSRDVAAGRTPGSILIGKTWHQLSGFAPLGNLLAIGASLARETAQEQKGILEPASEVAMQAIGEQPLLIGTQQIAQAMRAPGTTAEKLLGGIGGSFVPTAVADVAGLVDPQQREARGVLPQIQKRIPGASMALPAAQDVLGLPKEDRATAFFDPTRTSTDVAQQNPLIRELVRLDAGISGFERKEGETEDVYRGKVQAFGQIYTRYGQQLVSSQQYQRASEETKRRAVGFLNSRAKDAAMEGQSSGSNLAPAALISAAMAATAREAKKNAARK